MVLVELFLGIRLLLGNFKEIIPPQTIGCKHVCYNDYMVGVDVVNVAFAVVVAAIAFGVAVFWYQTYKQNHKDSTRNYNDITTLHVH